MVGYMPMRIALRALAAVFVIGTGSNVLRAAEAPAAPVRDESPLIYRVYRVTLTPTAESARLGAREHDDLIERQGGRFYSLEYTGRGCVIGDYSRVSGMRIWWVNGRMVFRVRATKPDDRNAFVEWAGLIRGSEISGDVRFVSPGVAMAPQQVEAAMAPFMDRAAAILANKQGEARRLLEEDLRAEETLSRHRLVLPG